MNDNEGLFTNKDRLLLTIVNNWIYWHRVSRVNYTTYNVQCSQDSLNPQTNSDIMMLSWDGDNAHPYWYAHVIGIFHAMVVHTGLKLQEPKKMEFLFIWWFGLDTKCSERGGWKAKKLHQIGFIEGDTAFGLLTPPTLFMPSTLSLGFCKVIQRIYWDILLLGQHSREMKTGYVFISICTLFLTVSEAIAYFLF